MTGYVLSPLAQADLSDIWDYTAAQFGEDQAETYVTTLRRAIEGVAANPLRGRRCDELRAGYFKVSSGSHVLFYRQLADVIDVVRILHQRMDFDRHL